MSASITSQTTFFLYATVSCYPTSEFPPFPFGGPSRSFPEEEELRRRGWLSGMTARSSGLSVDTNCAKWCRSLTAPFTRWNSAGSFPGASLSRRVVWYGIWRRSKPGWPRADQHRSSARNRPMSGSGGRARFESRVWLKQRHRRRDEYRHALLAFGPGVDDIRPFLHHVATLHLVLRLVVNAA
jgi:hypothetical protein